jgi:hypothetical protein
LRERAGVRASLRHRSTLALIRLRHLLPLAGEGNYF